MARLAILDRDGVINADSDAFVRSVAEWQPLPGSIDAIARLSNAGFVVTVASNQSGIGRGLFGRDVVYDMHRKMRRLVRRAGGRVAEIAFCPHAPDDGCDCRKPRTGLFTRIARRTGRAGLEVAQRIADDERILERQAGPACNACVEPRPRLAAIAASVGGMRAERDFGHAAARAAHEPSQLPVHVVDDLASEQAAPDPGLVAGHRHDEPRVREPRDGVDAAGQWLPLGDAANEVIAIRVDDAIPIENRKPGHVASAAATRLQLGHVGDLEEQAAHVAEQREPVATDGRVVGHDHDVVEELVDGRLQ